MENREIHEFSEYYERTGDSGSQKSWSVKQNKPEIVKMLKKAAVVIGGGAVIVTSTVASGDPILDPSLFLELSQRGPVSQSDGPTAAELTEGARGHVWDEGETVLEPGCETEGLIRYRCRFCDEIRELVIPSLGGHAWDEGELMCEGDCLTPGSVQFVCTVCGEKRTEETETAGHVELLTDALEPGCETEGSTGSIVCAVCGEILTEAEPIPALGHDFGDFVTEREPSCTGAGLRVRHCSRCEAEESETLPALGHTDADADFLCDRCGGILLRVECTDFRQRPTDVPGVLYFQATFTYNYDISGRKIYLAGESRDFMINDMLLRESGQMIILLQMDRPDAEPPFRVPFEFVVCGVDAADLNVKACQPFVFTLTGYDTEVLAVAKNGPINKSPVYY